MLGDRQITANFVKYRLIISLRLALKFCGHKSNIGKEDIMKENMKKSNCKTKSWTYVSCVWYSITIQFLVSYPERKDKKIQESIVL